MFGVGTLPAKARNIAPAHVIDHNEEDIGSFGGGRAEQSAQNYPEYKTSHVS